LFYNVLERKLNGLDFLNDGYDGNLWKKMEVFGREQKVVK